MLCGDDVCLSLQNLHPFNESACVLTPNPERSVCSRDRCTLTLLRSNDLIALTAERFCECFSAFQIISVSFDDNTQTRHLWHDRYTRSESANRWKIQWTCVFSSVDVHLTNVGNLIHSKIVVHCRRSVGNELNCREFPTFPPMTFANANLRNISTTLDYVGSTMTMCASETGSKRCRFSARESHRLNRVPRLADFLPKFRDLFDLGCVRETLTGASAFVPTGAVSADDVHCVCY